MTILPKYRLTKNIVSLLNQLEKLKTTLDLSPVNKKLEAYHRRKSILKSALYSARIEGNPLTEDDIPELRNDNRNRIEDHLLPRRSEILNIIRDHRQVSFDFLHRRFAVISPRLLRYDLKKLRDANLIKKLGVTRGALYEAVK